ncbi:MAG: GspE/PulE family protein [Patescibacteria group bacterium]
MHLLSEDIKKIVESTGLASEHDYQAAEEEAVRSNRLVLDILIGKGFIDEKYLAGSIAKFFNVPQINLSTVNISQDVLKLIPEAFAKSRGVILFEFNPEEKRGKLAMLDPEDFYTINYLRTLLNVWLDIYLMSQSDLKFGLRQYKKKINEEFGKVIEENLKESIGIAGALDMSKMIEAVPIVNIVNTIIEHAATSGASDIHFETFENKLIVRYRIDGILQEILNLPPVIAPILIARIKVLSNLQIDIHNAPQDGRFRFPIEDQFVDVRVSVIPTFHGEKGEMRLLKGSLRPLTLYELGFSQSELPKIEMAIKKPRGMILVTGPTGSGKTTTLYAILGILNTPKVNIVSVEDPIEYDIPGVNQTQVNVKAGLTFSSGLRSFVRQNPDIIMVGEIRDGETADIAVNASLTGHRLLSTLHTNDAPTAIPRLLDLNVQPFLISSTLNVVIAQRLVRKICTACVHSIKPGKELLNVLQSHLKSMDIKAKMPEMIYQGEGCGVCGFSGYRGQIGLFEILYVSDAIRELIIAKSGTNIIKNKARQEGMRLMFEDGLEKIESGQTTLEEVLRVAVE